MKLGSWDGATCYKAQGFGECMQLNLGEKIYLIIITFSPNQQGTDGTREWGIVHGGIIGTPWNCSRCHSQWFWAISRNPDCERMLWKEQERPGSSPGSSTHQVFLLKVWNKSFKLTAIIIISFQGRNRSSSNISHIAIHRGVIWKLEK